MLVFFATITLLVLAAKTRRFKFYVEATQNSFAGISLVLIAIFIAFDSVFYYYLKKISLQKAFSTFIQYLQYTFGLPFQKRVDISVLRVYPGNTFSVYLEYSLLVLIIVPILLELLHMLRRSVLGAGKNRISFGVIVYLAVLVPAVANAVVYLPLGNVGTKYLLFVCPMLALFTIDRVRIRYEKGRSRKAIVILLIQLMVVALCFVKFAAYWQDPKRGYGNILHTSMQPTVFWTSSYVRQGAVLADLSISGQLWAQVSFAGAADRVYVFPFDRGNVRFLYPPNASAAKELFGQRNYEYLLLTREYSRKVMPISGWSFLEPFGDNLSSIDGFANFARIYDDGTGSAYRYAPG